MLEQPRGKPTSVVPTKRFQWGCGLLFVVAMTSFVLLLSSTAGPFRAVSGQAVTAEQANAQLWNCFVPNGATDVWYTSGYRGTRIECTLAPASFAAWCRERAWTTHSINHDSPRSYYSEKAQDAVSVGNGLYFDAKKGDVGYYGVYDADAQRAYVTYSGG